MRSSRLRPVSICLISGNHGSDVARDFRFLQLHSGVRGDLVKEGEDRPEGNGGGTYRRALSSVNCVGTGASSVATNSSYGFSPLVSSGVNKTG